MDKVATIEVGEIVLFKRYDDEPRCNTGVVFKEQENGRYMIYSWQKEICKGVPKPWILPIDEIETARQEIASYYNEKIETLRGQIREATQEEKDMYKVQKYQSLKQEILATAKSLINYKDADDFENKLEALAYKKKQIFSIRLECVSAIRKENGRIKWEIRNQIHERDRLLENLTDEKNKERVDGLMKVID